MICPKCHNDKTYVISGVRTSTGYIRQRKCPKCHRVFETSENYKGIYSHGYKLKKAMPEMVGNAFKTTTPRKVGMT